MRGALLARDDFVEVTIEGERLDDGGMSRVSLRIANVLPYVTLKILAFQDRHQNKDAYDLIYTLLNAADGPRAAGERARSSVVRNDERVREALALLGERFADAEQDGPASYAQFLTAPDADDDEAARLRQQAVATIRAFLRGVAP